MDGKKAKEANRIFQHVLKNIKPSRAEAREIIYNVNNVVLRLKEIVPENVEIRVVGSIARSTNLKGDSDVDIFMLFDRSVSKESLSKKGLEYGKMLVDPKKGERYEIKYAEHPYVRVYLSSGIKADIVPASKVESAESMATSVDRTPMHTEFVNSSVTNRQRDDVRLLKYLLKAHGIYGAEAKTGGFSGYLCELLIIQFGSLLKFLDWTVRIKPPVTLYPIMKKTVAEDEEAFRKFGKRFVVIDPVDINRNVAAAVSGESFAKLVLVARAFVSNPTLKSFYGSGFTSSKSEELIYGFMKKSGLQFITLEFKISDKSPEVIWPQVNKAARKIEDLLHNNGFVTTFSMSWINGKEALIMMALPMQSITSRMIKGPDIFKTGNTGEFIEKHGKGMGFLVVESTLYALERNRYPNAESIFREIVKGKLMERHKDINLKNAKILINKVPKRHAYSAYVELRSKLNIRGFGE
jgi:tRNA nucleotidyltransferase (CCA-adding enzyme)